MYIIIGGDKKEYGPISADDVRLWITEGRLGEQSLIKAEGAAEFRSLGSVPEFAGAFAAKVPVPGMPPAFRGSAGPANWEERDYELDIIGCVSRGWNLLKENFGLLFVVALIFGLIEGFIAVLGMIPIIGPLLSLVNLIIVGPLVGGVYYVFIQTIRGRPAEVGEVFAGFSRAFGQLFLGHVVPALLAGLCLIPFGIVLAVEFIPLMAHGQLSEPNALPPISTAAAVILIAALFVCIIPMIYLQTCWAFTLPLIIDKEMDFWTAMGTSRKMVRKHWWHIFGLTILIGLLNLAGMLACCVGALFTAPLGIAAQMHAYETIFAEGQTA